MMALFDLSRRGFFILFPVQGDTSGITATTCNTSGRRAKGTKAGSVGRRIIIVALSTARWQLLSCCRVGIANTDARLPNVTR
jgi:hypothetical protein